MGRAMGNTWGIKPRVALWLHKMVLLSRLPYAAVVWWPRVEKVEARNQLKSLQGSYLMAVTGAMKSIPTEALEIALCSPPLNQTIICLVGLTAYKLKCQGEWKNAGVGHTRLGFLQHPFTLKQDKIFRKYHLKKNFQCLYFLLPTRENWKRFFPSIDPKVDYWYINGSGANDRYGAGIYGPRNSQRESIHLGKLATVSKRKYWPSTDVQKSC